MGKGTYGLQKKRERGRIQGLPKVLKVPPIISQTGKATDRLQIWPVHS